MHIHIQEQIKHNFLAIISLTIAVIALVYSTWRDEQTEKNLNIRMASFELLKCLGQLQTIVNLSHFDSSNSMADPFLGWGYVVLVSDLGELMPRPIPEETAKLKVVWQEEWQKIKSDRESVNRVSEQIDASREAIIAVIRKLR